MGKVLLLKRNFYVGLREITNVLGSREYSYSWM